MRKIKMMNQKIGWYFLILWFVVAINYANAEQIGMPGIEIIYYHSAEGKTYKGGGVHYRFAGNELTELIGVTYWDIEVVRCSKTNQELAFFEVGKDFFSTRTQAKIEEKKLRKWLIPYFGIKMGVVYTKEYKSQPELTPYLGMDIYSSELIKLSCRGGYFMPMKSHNEILRGPKLTLSLNYAW